MKSAHQGGSHCGALRFEVEIHVYDQVDMPNMLGRPYVNVSVACLDNVDVDELIASPVRNGDGLNNAWGSTPKETRHL